MSSIALRTHYIPNYDGQTASLSRLGIVLTPHIRLHSHCSRILGLTNVHKNTMPLHIACMYHLSHLNSQLFLLAHELVDKEPENAISWYSVGIWYMCVEKYQEARTYFR